MEQIPLIELKKISKQYGKNTQYIFNDANLSIYPCEVVGIIGKNGCGKTTLVKIISGLITPEQGDIFFMGKKIDTNDITYKRNISILGDANRSLYWNLTGRQNVEYFTSLMGADLDEDFFDEFVTKMKMGTFIDNKVANYSKGMKQKLMLLIALINSPQLVIMDEPLNGLDMESVYIIEDVINTIVREKHTSFIITSHDKYFIDEVCTTKYEIVKTGTLARVDENCATIRQFTLYVQVKDCSNDSKIGSRIRIVDEKQKIYSLSLSLNEYDIYHELSQGIKEKNFKVVSILV